MTKEAKRMINDAINILDLPLREQAYFKSFCEMLYVQGQRDYIAEQLEKLEKKDN